MKTELRISYNTAKNQHSVQAYAITLGDTVQASTGRLNSEAPTVNGIARCGGIFPTKSAAVRALLAYVAVNSMVLETVDVLTGKTSHHLARLGKIPRPSDGYGCRSIGHKTAHGEWVAN